MLRSPGNDQLLCGRDCGLWLEYISNLAHKRNPNLAGQAQIHVSDENNSFVLCKGLKDDDHLSRSSLTARHFRYQLRHSLMDDVHLLTARHFRYELHT